MPKHTNIDPAMQVFGEMLMRNATGAKAARLAEALAATPTKSDVGRTAKMVVIACRLATEREPQTTDRLTLSLIQDLIGVQPFINLMTEARGFA